MDRVKRKRALGLITFLIVVPLLSMFWNPSVGIYLFFGGLLLASVINFILVRDARKEFLTYKDSCPSPDRAGDIIWVSLDDEHGNPLPEVEAQHKLDEARAQAGPMDQVRVKPSKK